MPKNKVFLIKATFYGQNVSRETFCPYLDTFHVNQRIIRLMSKDLSSRKVGILGEDIASKYLCDKGHYVLDRNYRKKWGEIDIISRKDKCIHFVEVKTVSDKMVGVAGSRDTYRPEDNVHPNKLKRLHRAIETYCAEKGVKEDWQIDVVTVRLNIDKKHAKVEYLDNIIL